MSRSSQLATLFAGAFFVALAMFGARMHWVEEIGSAERDGYVSQAEHILQGDWPKDPFRPPLVPIAIASLSWITGDAFAAARLLANLSAAALVLLAFGFGRRLSAAPSSSPTNTRSISIDSGARAGFWAMALVAANPNTWILGQHVTTDMPFAALAAAALLAGLAYLQRPSTGAAAAAGLAFGAGACTRGNALLLAPALLVAWWLGGRENAAPEDPRAPRRSLPHLALALGLATLAILPSWILRARAFGSPFYDENWKNLVWKLHGYPDWSVLDRIPPGGSFARIVLDEPGALLAGAWSEIARFADSGAAQLLGTWLHVVAAALGIWLCLRSARRREALWLVFAGATFTLGIATAFFAWGRFLLCLLAPLAGLAAAGPHLRPLSLVPRRLATAGGVVLIGVLAAKTALFRLPAFVEHHPYVDIEVLQRLERELDPGETLAGTSPFLERYLSHPYYAIPDAFGTETKDAQPYLDRLLADLRAHRAGYLVVGAADLRDRPRVLLDATTTPPGLSLAERDSRITVWRVSRAAGAAAPAPRKLDAAEARPR